MKLINIVWNMTLYKLSTCVFDFTQSRVLSLSPLSLSVPLLFISMGLLWYAFRLTHWQNRHPRQTSAATSSTKICIVLQTIFPSHAIYPRARVCTLFLFDFCMLSRCIPRRTWIHRSGRKIYNKSIYACRLIMNNNNNSSSSQ